MLSTYVLGDEFKVTCEFQSMTRNTTTYFGQGTYVRIKPYKTKIIPLRSRNLERPVIISFIVGKY